MRFEREISRTFERNAIEYFEKDFDKHKKYLLKVVFGRGSSSLPLQDFENALFGYATDPRGCIKELLNVLLPTIRQTMDTIHERARSLLGKYNSGLLSVTDKGSGMVDVQSDSDSSKTYKVNLKELQCDCPYYQKVKFAGMLCKHIYLADEIFGTSQGNTNAIPIEEVADVAVPEKLDVTVSDGFFCYGSQKLTRREKRGNPYIPSGIRYVLEGKKPELVLYAIENRETLLLIGESGVGKSRMIQYFAQETNTPLLNACGHNEITVENLLGNMTVINGSTVWRNGILPEAMRRGYWLLLDEINSIEPGVMKVINELLDNGKITITIAGEPRLVKAHKDFRLICTMNPPDSPIYKGIETMSFELMDRFDTVVHLDYLSPETEKEQIMELSGFGDMDTAKKIVQFANSIRQAVKQGEIFATVTTRSLVSFCKKAKSFDVRASAEASILCKMSQADKDKATDLFNAIFK